MRGIPDCQRDRARPGGDRHRDELFRASSDRVQGRGAGEQCARPARDRAGCRNAARAARAGASRARDRSRTPSAALEDLEAGKVNLAVVRSDAAMQGGAHTVMIMRREVAVLIAPKVGKLQKVTDLPNVTIGVAREGPLDNTCCRRCSTITASRATRRNTWRCRWTRSPTRSGRRRSTALIAVAGVCVEADERRDRRSREGHQGRDPVHRHRGGGRDRQAHPGAGIDRDRTGHVRRAAAAPGRERSTRSATRSGWWRRRSPTTTRSPT